MERRKAVTSVEDIDLLGLLTAFINLIRRYILLIIGCAILGIVVGWVLYSMASPTYKTRMIADSGILPNTEIINIIASWQNLKRKGDNVTLANKLNLSIKTVQKISSLEAEDTKKDNPAQITEEKNENSFMISAVVTDVEILDSLENAIIYALENNEYVKKRSALRKQNLELLKQKISAEITDLDSVKHSFRGLLNSGRPNSATFLTSPTEVNLQIVELYERILNLETSIKLSEDIQVIESFTKTTQPDGPKRTSYLLYGFIIGCIIAVSFIVIRVISKKIKAYSDSSVYSS